MTHTFLLAVVLGLLGFAGSAGADVKIYTSANCKGQSYTFVEPVYIPDLSPYKYWYSCTKSNGREGIPYDAYCKDGFNDKVRSVRIGEGERVVVYRNFRYRGDREFMDDGNGCYNVYDLYNKVSSMTIDD